MNFEPLPASSKTLFFTRKAPLPLLCTILTSAFLGASASAVTLWQATSGDFKSAGNWTSGVPSQTSGAVYQDGAIDNFGTAIISSPLATGLREFRLGSDVTSNSAGTLVVTGAGRANFSSTIIVGGRGSTGTLTISNGGQVTTLNMPIAGDFGSTGTVTVTGAGSLLQTTSSVRVGSTGAGTLNVENGAAYRAGANGTGTMYVGVEVSANGTINVGNNSAVSEFSAGAIVLGNGELNTKTGVATLNFGQTNTLTVGAQMLGQYSFLNPDSTFDVNQTGPGKTILTSQGSRMAGRFTVTNGTMLVNGRIEGEISDFVQDDEVVEKRVTHTFTVNRQGTLGGSGYIEGITTVGGQAPQPIKDASGNITGMTPDTRGGTLAPGDGIGLLTFGTDLTLNQYATLTMELGGGNRGVSYDALNVNGALTYGGTLRLTLANGFRPNALDSFDLFNGYTSFTGTFESILFDAPGYTASFARQTGILTVLTVPEPSSAVTTLLGAAVLGMRHRRLRA